MQPALGGKDIAVKTDEAATGLRLDVLEYESNDPDKKDFLKIGVSARISKFAGSTVIWASEPDIENFATELAAFATSFTGGPELRCGAGTMLLFKISVVAADNLGHATVRLEIRSEQYPPENLLILEFGSEPQLLIDFAAKLHHALIETKGASVHLPDRPYHRSSAGRPQPGERLH